MQVPLPISSRRAWGIPWQRKTLCILGCSEFSLWRLGLSSSFALVVTVSKQGRAQRQRVLHSLTLLLTREVGTWQRAHLGDRERTALMFHMCECLDGRFVRMGRSRSDGRTDGIIEREGTREGRWLVAQKPVWTAAAERFSCQKPEATAAAAITSDLGAGKFRPYVNASTSWWMPKSKTVKYVRANKWAHDVCQIGLI